MNTFPSSGESRLVLTSTEVQPVSLCFNYSNLSSNRLSNDSDGHDQEEPYGRRSQSSLLGLIRSPPGRRWLHFSTA